MNTPGASLKRRMRRNSEAVTSLSPGRLVMFQGGRTWSQVRLLGFVKGSGAVGLEKPRKPPYVSGELLYMRSRYQKVRGKSPLFSSAYMMKACPSDRKLLPHATRFAASRALPSEGSRS